MVWFLFLCKFSQVEFEKVSLLRQDILTDLCNWLIFIMPSPFLFLAIYLVVLSLTDGLFSPKKSSNSFSIALILLRLRLGTTAATWVNLGRHIVFMMVNLPKNFRNLCLHELSSFFNFFEAAVIV